MTELNPYLSSVRLECVTEGLQQSFILPPQTRPLNGWSVDQQNCQDPPGLQCDEGSEVRQSAEQINRMSKSTIETVRHQLLGFHANHERAAQLFSGDHPEHKAARVNGQPHRPKHGSLADAKSCEPNREINDDV